LHQFIKGANNARAQMEAALNSIGQSDTKGEDEARLKKRVAK